MLHAISDASGLALALSNSLAIGRFPPWRQAMCRAVVPLLLARSTAAPCCISTLTSSVLPPLAATRRGVLVALFARLGSAPAPRRVCAMGILFKPEALINPVSPIQSPVSFSAPANTIRVTSSGCS